MKRLLHRIGMGFYELGYSVWVKSDLATKKRTHREVMLLVCILIVHILLDL